MEPKNELNVEEYLLYLDEYDMSLEQKKGLIEELYELMKTFVDIGFGVDPVSNILLEREGKEDF